MGSKKLGNNPKMMMFRLLFEQKPSIDLQAVLEELKQVFPNVTFAKEANVFTFPDCEVEFEEGIVPAQCVVMHAEDDSVKKIDQKYTEQNWHWEEGAEVLKNCQYEVLVTDFLSRSLEPRIRIVLMQQMLFAMAKVAQPTIIVSEHGEKLIDPEVFMRDCLDPNYVALDLMINVRLYNVNQPEYGSLLMDTVGLHALGISDFQFFFDDDTIVNEVAGRLWDYAYYLMEAGDVIEDGNTIEGFEPGSKWTCHKEFSSSQPRRTVINVVMS
ncbi:DUF4261 domain-containing protein [Myroides odoratimimus]|uniref:DUF4261 domain-containing protein n=2 Tax=Myroides TaxID=76831 RepID=A0AAJ4W4F9_MYRPR|nr:MULTISPECIES: DUF4261 domain-containing protein [Myroides]AJA69299.1 Protein of unknown function DUF4261 [Myroides sp. A21]AJH14154.1 hypothetical protein MPR_0963 [Myroides profundi]EHO11984.1 hypothetical protein HMPREF9712_00231 [Myroides odoratimimus CCUG 10230]EHO13016.1 hypothetical protein HMPREF9714_01074 [Myroides odoratimimus CCUG 12901]EKB03292.1 hypothetical protein HMPREF9711_02619 [Myroides odoratimimus CCUG 3837]